MKYRLHSMVALATSIMYVWLCGTCYATPISDSLQVELHKTTTPDTVRVMLYNAIAREIGNTAFQNATTIEPQTQYRKAIQYADSGMLLTRQIGFKKGEAELYRTLGAMLYFLHEFDQAIFYYEKAYELSSELNDEQAKAALMYNIGLTYFNQAKYVQALQYNLTAISMWSQLGYKERILLGYSNIIDIYKMIKENDLAIEYGNKAISLAYELNDTIRVASLYDVMATPYLFLSDTSASIKAYEKSIDLYHQQRSHQNEARVLHNYATDIYGKSYPRKAIQLLNKSSQLYEQLNPHFFALAIVYQNMSKAYKTIGKQDSATYFQDKSRQKALLSEHALTISTIYVWLGNEALENKQFDAAKNYYVKAAETNQHVGNAEINKGIWNGLIGVYIQTGNEKLAHELMYRVIRIQDSLNIEANKAQMAILQMQNELKDQQEQQAREWTAQAMQQQQLFERRHRLIIYSFIVLGIFAILLGKLMINYWRNRKNKFLLQERHEEILQIQEELRQSNDELHMYQEHLEEMIHQQTAALADKDLQLRTMSDNLPGGFLYRKMVRPDGIEYISYISSNVKQMVGVSAEQLTKATGNLLALMGDNDLVRQLVEKEKECTQKMEPFIFEFPLTKDNQPIWIYNHSFPHIDAEHNIVWDGFVIDITKEKEEEYSLRKAKEQAEESDRLKSIFLSNMSHEIRTPMNAILGFIGFIEKENLPTETRKEYIQIIHDNVAQLLQLIENIINISKIEVQQIIIYPTEFALNELMAEMEHSWLDTISNKKSLYLILDDSQFIEPDIVYNDSERLKQVLSNLINNAVKYTDKGYIRFGYQSTEDPSELLFFIEDTGIGIPKSQYEPIFKYFRQGAGTELAPKYGGTGLGLSISKGLVELMGGRIWVESTEGQGSTFFFTFKKTFETTLKEEL